MSRMFLSLWLICLAAPVMAGDKLIPLTPAQRAALRVVAAPIAAHAGAVSVGLPARVAIPPAQERVVAAPVAGLVSEARVAAGDTVRAGQVLALLRGEELIGAQRDLAHARALLDERRAWLRLMGLSGAAIQAAEFGQRLADSVALTAPMAGVVLEQTAVTGARVEAAHALFVTGEYLSVPASVCFIALLGTAVLNGVVLVSTSTSSPPRAWRPPGWCARGRCARC